MNENFRTTSAPNSANKPRGKPFEPGNREGKGRPRGSRNKRTLLWEQITEQYADAFFRRVLKKGFEGDRTAMKLILERLVPPAQNNYVELDLPELITAADIKEASMKVIQATAKGELTTEEGKAMTDMLQGHLRTIETEELERRVAALEETRPATAEALSDAPIESKDTPSREETPTSSEEALDA